MREEEAKEMTFKPKIKGDKYPGSRTAARAGRTQEGTTHKDGHEPKTRGSNADPMSKKKSARPAYERLYAKHNSNKGSFPPPQCPFIVYHSHVP